MAGKKKSDPLPIELLTRTEFTVYLLIRLSVLGVIAYAISHFLIDRFGQDLGLVLTVATAWAVGFLTNRVSRDLVRRYNRHKKSIKKAKH